MTETEKLYELMQKEEVLKKYSGEDEVILSYDMLELLEKRASEKHDVEMRSCFPSLDSKIHSFLGGELTIISGPTKHGKTLFAQTLTRNFYNQGKACLWFTYEVPAHQFLKQFGDQLPVFSLPKTLKSNSDTWIVDRVHEAKLKYNIDAVFIDNTQNVINQKSSNLVQVMDEFAKTAKRIALEMNVGMFLLHHITKTKLEAGEDITSELLRGSSMFAQTADNVFFVWRDKDQILNPNKSYLKVTENRRFGVMNHITHMVKIGNFLEESEFQHGQ